MTSAGQISEMEELESSAAIWSTLGTVGSGQLTHGRADRETVLLHVLGKGAGELKNFLTVCGSSCF